MPERGLRAPLRRRPSAAWRSPTRSTSSATGWGSSPSRSWSSTRPAAPSPPPRLFLGTRFLPALLAPLLVVRAERGPPRFALPVIYCGEAAVVRRPGAAGGELLAGRRGRRSPRSTGPWRSTGRALTRAVVAALLEPAGELRAGNAILNVAFTGGAAVGPGARPACVVAGFGVQTALLLDAASFYAIAWILLTAGPLPQAEPEPGRFRERLARRARLHPGRSRRCAGC